MAIKCVFASANDKATMVGWLRDAAAGETERSVEFANIEGGAEPNNAYWDAATTSVKAGLPHTQVPTQSQVDGYLNRCLDHMRNGWITTAGGTVTSDAVAITRWRDTRYWIGSLHAAMTGVITSTVLTDAQKVYCWTATQILCPDDPALIAFWYRNHAQAFWNAFAANLETTAKGAYVGFLYTDTTLPTFASDAGSGHSWNGGPGTLEANVPQNWNGA